ncbi:MAG: ATP-dependent DNA helicase [Luteibaculaceae bacterium]
MNLTPQTLEQSIRAFVGFEPTEGQHDFIKRVARFLLTQTDRKFFLLQGYAGTGKTSLMAALVKSASQFGIKVILLAPTGRAAKVISGYSKQKASTIHRQIYTRKKGADGSFQFTIAPNLNSNSIFIVDEVSMINSASYEAASLGVANVLDDLFSYVYSAHNNALIFVGDDAQLPPVGSDYSPALNLKELIAEYYLKAGHVKLTEVVRQQQESGILYNATKLRINLLESPPGIPKIEVEDYFDVEVVTGYSLPEHLESDFAKYGEEEVLVVTKSNQRAYQFSMQIRTRILGFEDKLVAGEKLMVVKNNYYWLTKNEINGFIANGDVITVNRFHKIEEKFGFTFAHVSFYMPEYSEENEIEAIVLLNTLDYNAASLNQADNDKLFNNISLLYEDEPNRKKRNKLVMENPYYQALQIKYAYAVTCHKAQGGQWQVVYVDHGYLTEEMLDYGFIRWLYTAVTRASVKLKLINFSPLLLDKNPYEDLF